MTPTTDSFFETLEPFSRFSQFSDINLYRPLPDDWLVVITDIERSTRAIEKGRYKQVNGVGVASIVALINAVKPMQVPYIFGGDGATACIPETVFERVKPALLATQRLSQEEFGLKLRVGLVKMAEIREQGYEVYVGKYGPNPHFQQAMLQGNGISYAEKLIKGKSAQNPYLLEMNPKKEITNDGTIFEGFECRWNEIPSPHEENVALMVQALGNSSMANNQIYAHVLDEIREIYGEGAQHHPLQESKLALTTSNRLLSVEARIRTAFQSKWEQFKYAFMLQINRLIGIWLMTFGIQTQTTDWSKYKQNLIANTDYQKFDQVLRMIIAGTEAQNRQLRATLEEYRKKGELVFGIHTSASALITCIVTNYDTDHVHFLDGSSGGYTMASQELKEQLHHIRGS